MPDRGKARVSREWMRYLLVGSVGFVVDGGILLLLVHAGHASPIWARIPSFMTAVTVTWWLHRHFTFGVAQHTAPSVREWSFFAVANALGNGLNLALYWLLVWGFDWAPLAALAFASIAAAAINYRVSAQWVFRRDHGAPGS